MERRRRLGAGDHLTLFDVSNVLPSTPVDGIVVVVEPTWGCVAVAVALDAGWESVELAPAEPQDIPIPLVSFEQRPPNDATRCRVRSADLVACLVPLLPDDPATVLFGAPAFARPLAASIARTSPSSICLVACPAPDSAMAADAWWACGMLIRVLLEELDGDGGGDVELTDAAGIAVTIAQGAEDAAAQLSAGRRWRDHLERGGHGDDLRVASAVDSIGAVPIVAREGGALVARAWVPPAAPAPPAT